MDPPFQTTPGLFLCSGHPHIGFEFCVTNLSSFCNKYQQKKQLRKTALAREADLRGPMAHQEGQAWCQESEAAGNTAGKSGGR